MQDVEKEMEEALIRNEDQIGNLEDQVTSLSNEIGKYKEKAKKSELKLRQI